MFPNKTLRVAVLIDLPRTPLSGGHVRGWERLAHAAAGANDLPLDLTLYFSGEALVEKVAPHVTFRHMPPVFSTSRLTFLPYVPDHTDLAPYHPRLAKELETYDVIHTTDGFFAFARTAERVARTHSIALTNSFHTDTPGYARVFTRRTLETLCGKNAFSRFLTDTLRLPEKQEAKMTRRLQDHLRKCQHAMATRGIDMELASEILGGANVSFLRTPVNRETFGPHRKDRAGIEETYNIPAGRVVMLFIGRLDEGKNIYTLISALETLIDQGLPVHLVTAGVGPAESTLREKLAGHVSVAGFVQPEELGRLLASVDLVTHPSEVEMRSLVAIEGMASGKPVLLAEKSGVSKHYGKPEALIDVGEKPADWAKALRPLITDASLRAHYGQKALAYAERHVPTPLDLIVQDFLPVWQRAFHEKRG